MINNKKRDSSVHRLLLLCYCCLIGYPLIWLSGCGGGGSTPTPPDPATTNLRLTIEWDGFSRALLPPASAMSCYVELLAVESTGATAAHTWVIDRSESPTGYVQTWISPTAVRTGQWRLAVTCYASHQAQGDIVAIADQVIILDGNGNGAGNITLVNQIVTVEVDDLSMTSGERQLLWCVARNAQGAVIAVPPLSIRWTVLDGNDHVQIVQNEIEALSAGKAHVRATVDGIESRSAQITILPDPDDPPRTKTLMALGDSITVGLGSHTSYRYYLWKMLQSAGYTNVNFVGSQSGIGEGRQPLDHNWDEDHEGHSGWKTDDILNGYTSTDGKLGGPTGWAMTFKPDIVLIQLGTNDLGSGRRPEDVIRYLESIIETLRLANPSVRIGLAQLTPARSDYDAIPNLTDEDYRYFVAINSSINEFNRLIVDCAARQASTTSPVIVVDLYTIIDPPTQEPDGLHPNDTGCQKMATAWYPVVKAFLDSRLALPRFGISALQ